MFFVFLPIYPLHADEPDAADPDETEESEDMLESNSIFLFKGQVKNLYVQTKTDEYSKTGDPKKLIANLARLRLSPELNLSDILLLHVDYDNEFIAGNYLKSREFDESWRTSDYNDLFHNSREPHYDKKIYYRTKVHRAYAKLTTGNLTATIGRQQIRFGSGRLWNPLDILNPVDPLGIEGAEEQKGTDALRLEYYPDDKTEIGIIIDGKRVNDRLGDPDFPEKNSNLIGRARTTIGETELAVLGGKVAERAVGGADVSVILYDGTLRGSILYSHPEQGRAYSVAGSGYEYNFAFGLYFLLEYFYNQAGLNYNKRISSAFFKSRMLGMDEGSYGYLANQFITYNQHYSGILSGYDISALIRGELFIIYDWQGRGMLINPSLKYNAFQNVDIMAGILAGHVFEGASNTSDFEIFSRNSLFYASIVCFF